ncbi:hypothetical protein EYF80_029543 [Liparis tanakae]|uniref:Uncharacterized protein n=1 Tax=Liparis tanakae TaxID=230148 RepID=A0A4Z2H2W9_9TELE|nr:hypothetical protein EYF80_029543 [Liparis tanakae]
MVSFAYTHKSSSSRRRSDVEPRGASRRVVKRAGGPRRCLVEVHLGKHGPDEGMDAVVVVLPTGQSKQSR